MSVFYSKGHTYETHQAWSGSSFLEYDCNFDDKVLANSNRPALKIFNNLGNPQDLVAGACAQDEQVQEQPYQHAQGDSAHEQTQPPKYTEARRFIIMPMLESFQYR